MFFCSLPLVLGITRNNNNRYAIRWFELCCCCLGMHFYYSSITWSTLLIVSLLLSKLQNEDRNIVEGSIFITIWVIIHNYILRYLVPYALLHVYSMRLPIYKLHNLLTNFMCLAKNRFCSLACQKLNLIKYLNLVSKTWLTHLCIDFWQYLFVSRIEINIFIHHCIIVNGFSPFQGFLIVMDDVGQQIQWFYPFIRTNCMVMILKSNYAQLCKSGIWARLEREQNQ